MKIELSEQEIDALANKLVTRILPLLKEQLNTQDEILSLEEACNFLKCKKSWLYKAVQQRKIPAIKTGKYLKFSKKELEKWLRKC